MAKRKTKKKSASNAGNSHDSLFKLTFGTLEIVQDYINTFFPPELVEGMDLAAMRLDANSYIDNELKNYFSDVVWNIPFQGMVVSPVFLFEHKSNPDSNVLVQVLRYMLCIWEHDLRQKTEEKLRVVIPIIVYHGQKEWELKPFEDLFGPVQADLKKYIPSFDFLFENLVDIPDKVLMALEKASTFATLVTLARAFNDDFFLKYFGEISNRLAQGPLGEEEGNLLSTILVYVFRISKKDKAEIITILDNLPKKLKPTIMSTYDMIVESGIEKGIELKNIELIRKGLKKDMSTRELSEWTDLPENEVLEIMDKLKKGAL